MLTYTIHQASFNPKSTELDTLTTSACIARTPQLMQKIVDAFDSLFKGAQNGAKPFYEKYANKKEWVKFHRNLLAEILFEIEHLNYPMIKSPSAHKYSAEIINNQKVIQHLKDLTENENANLLAIMKAISLLKIAGIERLQFNIAHDLKNISKLLDIDYPLLNLPEGYLFRPTEQDAINLFIKKAEYLYFAFHDNKGYERLYHDSSVAKLMHDTNCSYEDFCIEASKYMNPESCPYFVLFKPQRKIDVKTAIPLPTKCILDLLIKFKIHTFAPEKQDYEKLVRRLAGLANYEGLSELLQSPILDALKVDVFAESNTNESAFSLINSNKRKHTHLQEKYSLCEELLENYKPTNTSEKKQCRDMAPVI